MMQLPVPLLGQITAFTINTPNLETSLAFYSKIGFSELFRADWPFPWVQLTDGAVLIMLKKEARPYISLTYYTDDIDRLALSLEEKGIVFFSRTAPADLFKRYVMQSPDGAMVAVVGLPEGFSQPPGPVMLKMNPADFNQPDKYVNKICGMFGEFAQPVADLDIAAGWYAQLGFKQITRYTAPYPWGIYTDGLAVVGLHQTTNFTQPAITFFAADMQQKLAALKGLGLPVNGEKNETITTPEGQKLNLFSLGF